MLRLTLPSGNSLTIDGGRRPAVARDPQAGRDPDAALDRPVALGAGAAPRAQPNALAPSVRHCSRPVVVYGWSPRAWLTVGTFLQPQLDRVHPDRLRERVHHLLEGPRALRVAGRAERRAPARR